MFELQIVNWALNQFTSLDARILYGTTPLTLFPRTFGDEK